MPVTGFVTKSVHIFIDDLGDAHGDGNSIVQNNLILKISILCIRR